MKKLIMALAIVALAIVVWIGCGLFNYGAVLTYYNTEYPDSNNYSHHGIAVAMAIMGPFETPGSFVCSGFLKHGWRLK